MTYKAFVPVAAIAAAGLVLYGSITAVKAQTTTPGNNIQSLVQRIAQRFGLKETDVQQVFDEQKATRLSTLRSKYEQFLTQAVKDGKITDNQKSLLLSKYDELAAKRQSEINDLKNKTSQERRMILQNDRADLLNWAKQNNIDLTYLQWGKGMGMHGGRGWMMGP